HRVPPPRNLVASTGGSSPPQQRLQVFPVGDGRRATEVLANVHAQPPLDGRAIRQQSRRCLPMLRIMARDDPVWDVQAVDAVQETTPLGTKDRPYQPDLFGPALVLIQRRQEGPGAPRVLAHLARERGQKFLGLGPPAVVARDPVQPQPS